MRICEDCGFNNEPDRLFCGACGEPIQGEAKLIRDTEKLKEKKKRRRRLQPILKMWCHRGIPPLRLRLYSVVRRKRTMD